MELLGQPVQIVIASHRNWICARRMPSILLKGHNQRGIADILRFPQHDRKRKLRDQVKQLNQPLGGNKIIWIRCEVSCIFFQALADFIFESG